MGSLLTGHSKVCRPVPRHLSNQYKASHYQAFPRSQRGLHIGTDLTAQRCSAQRDPLDREVWDSWKEGEDEEWETEKFTEDELVQILFEEDGSPETAAQNILAIALALLLALAFTSILWRMTIVSWALVSAAVRYSFVSILLLVLLILVF